MISRPLPLITYRISFSTKALPMQPTITPRLKFSAKATSKPKEPLHSCPDRDLTPSIADSDDDEPLANDDGESELSDQSEIEIDVPTKKIPKPAGEPGRPGSGGYSIETVLAPWGKEEFAKVNKLVKKLADLKLDQTKSYSKQSSRKVGRHHTVVEKYEGHWPIRAILKLHLKTTSENHRRKGGKDKNKVAMQ